LIKGLLILKASRFLRGSEDDPKTPQTITDLEKITKFTVLILIKIGSKDFS